MSWQEKREEALERKSCEAVFVVLGGAETL